MNILRFWLVAGQKQSIFPHKLWKTLKTFFWYFIDKMINEVFDNENNLQLFVFMTMLYKSTKKICWIVKLKKQNHRASLKTEQSNNPLTPLGRSGFVDTSTTTHSTTVSDNGAGSIFMSCWPFDSHSCQHLRHNYDREIFSESSDMSNFTLQCN